MAHMITTGLRFRSLYVVLVGFDLGVGLRLLFADGKDRRGIMTASLGHQRDLAGTVRRCAVRPFPRVFGLIFRGVAFEFHEHARRRDCWGVAFGAGSVLAASRDGTWPGCRLVPLARTAAQKIDEVLRRQRTAVVVPLHDVATVMPEEV